MGGPWYLQARGCKRLGLGDFSWCELEEFLCLHWSLNPGKDHVFLDCAVGKHSFMALESTSGCHNQKYHNTELRLLVLVVLGLPVCSVLPQNLFQVFLQFLRE